MSGLIEPELGIEKAETNFARRTIQRSDDLRKHVRKKNMGPNRSQAGSTRSDPGYTTAGTSTLLRDNEHAYLPQHSLDSSMDRLASTTDNVSDASVDSSYISTGDSSASSGDIERSPTNPDSFSDVKDTESADDFSKFAQNTISKLENMIDNIELTDSSSLKHDSNHNVQSSCHNDEGNISSSDSDDPLELLESAVTSVGIDVARGVGIVGEAASNAWDFFSSTLDRLISADQDSDASWHDVDSDVSNTEIETDTFQDAQEDLRPKDKLHHICSELLNTEEAYVERLNIIVKVKDKTKLLLGNELARQMFHDIETIYTFHHNYLLPTLQDRLKKWGQYEKIGDVMKKLTPFLKLYTEYIKDFQKSSALVSSYEEKSSSFASMLKDAQMNQPARCGKQSIQTHMMEPVQRVPRYELLLKDYLKHLHAKSEDRHDTEEALHSVSQAAQHFEETMKRDSRIATLMEIQAKLDGTHAIVAPQRELIKEGSLHRVGARGGLSDRYIYLFSDFVLICSKVNLVLMEKLRVKADFHLTDAWVIEGTNLEYPNTFCLRSWESFVEFHASSLEDKLDWVSAIRNAKDKLASKIDHLDPQEDTGVSRCSGQLLVSSDAGKTWKKKHLAIHTNGWMYTYRSSNDSEAITGINLNHFSKKMVKAPSGKRGKTILLAAIGKKYYFYSETESILGRWMSQMDTTADLITKKKKVPTATLR